MTLDEAINEAIANVTASSLYDLFWRNTQNSIFDAVEKDFTEQRIDHHTTEIIDELTEQATSTIVYESIELSAHRGSR